MSYFLMLHTDFLVSTFQQFKKKKKRIKYLACLLELLYTIASGLRLYLLLVDHYGSENVAFILQVKEGIGNT